jgi:hypothetical protein
MLDLSSSSTAAIALVFIPVYGAIAVLIGWVLGLLAHKTVKGDRGRRWLIAFWGSTAVLFGTGIGINESIITMKREDRFPVVTVNALPLSKRMAYSDKSIGWVHL